MQSKIIERILTENNEELQEIIDTIKNNVIFQEIMSNVKEDYFVDDRIHGLSHNERVTLIACYIGIEEGLTDEEIANLLYAALYHDIGRKVIPKGARGIGVRHGIESAKILEHNSDELLPNKSPEDIQIINALCIAHSVDDTKIEEALKENNIILDDRTLKLISILKDADALDRVRLPRGRLDENYLRTETSKTMIELSKKLFREYKKIEKEQMNERIGNTDETLHQLLFDGQNYYLLRSLNTKDIENLKNGKEIYPKSYTHGEYSVKDVLEHSSAVANSTSKFISMSSDPNVVLTYDRANLHRFILIKLNQDELKSSEKVFSAGDYLLKEMENQIKILSENAPENIKQIIQGVENATSIEEIKEIINGADKKVSTNLIDSEQQYLTQEEEFEQAKKIAICKVLNYYGLMQNIVKSSEKMGTIEKYTATMRVAYHNSEWLYADKIDQERIIDIPKILIDSLALVKQAEFQGKDKKKLMQLEQRILRLAISRSKINQKEYHIEYSSHDILRNDLTIDRAFQMTNGQISYTDTNMQLTAIRSIAEMTLNKRKIIALLKQQVPDIDVENLLKNTYCVNQEMITRQNNKGSQIGKNINFEISDYGYSFDSKISMQILENVESLSDEQLINIISEGIDAPGIIDIFAKISTRRLELPKNKTLSSKYIIEAIVEGYNGKKDGASFTKKEKLLIAKKLSQNISEKNELYKLYEALTKIKIQDKGFTQNEIFAIIINMAIDGKCGNISYKELISKTRMEIQFALLDNKEYLQTSILPISIDFLTGHGKGIKQLKSELERLGISKEIIKSTNVKNLYVAKQIVEQYEFVTSITNEEKGALITAILNNSSLDNRYIYTIMQHLERIGLDKQQIYGTIINLGVNRTIIRRSGFDYTRLLSNAGECCYKLAQFKDEIQTYVTEGTIQKAIVQNRVSSNEEELKKDFLKLGLSQELIGSRNPQNLYIARQIVEQYNFKRELTAEEKSAVIKAILMNTALEKQKRCSLDTLIQNLIKTGFDEQQVYGMIINLSINQKILPIRGFSYSNLIYNINDACRKIGKYMDEIQTDVTEETLRKVTEKNEEHALNSIEIKQLNKELNDLGIDNEFIQTKKIQNVYTAKKIVEQYQFKRSITNDEKKAIIIALLSPSKLNEKKHGYVYLSNVIQKIKLVGFEEQQIYGMLINWAINSMSVHNVRYTYSNLLNNVENALKIIKKYQEEINTEVTEDTVQQSAKKIYKKRKIIGKDIVQATMELTIEGSGGSEICDAVQADYERLINEKSKKNEQKGDEQGESN